MPHLKTEQTFFMLIDSKGVHIVNTAVQAKPEADGKFKAFEFAIDENGHLKSIIRTTKDKHGFTSRVEYKGREQTTILGATFRVGQPWKLPSTSNADLHRLFKVSERLREAA